MKRKLLSVLLIAVLVVSLLAGCQNNNENANANTNEDANKNVVNDSNDNENDEENVVSNDNQVLEDNNNVAEEDAEPVETKPFKIAIGLPDSGITMFSLMSNNIRAFAKAAGGEAVFEGGVSASADATIAFVENQIAAGVDGIIFGPPADSVLPTVATLCDEAGVYWSICFRNILDEEVKEFVEASEYYVGKVYEVEQKTGYQVMSNLNDLGMEKIAIISMPKGNTTTDLREKGIEEACGEFGMEIVAEARDISQASDATSATESFLTAYSDLDAVYIVGATGAGVHEAAAKAIEDAGRSDEVKLATIDFPDSMGELFDSGILVACSGLPSWGFDPYMSGVMLSNACMGTPVSDEPMTITCSMFDINDGQTAVRWLEKFGDAQTLYHSDEEMKNLMKAYNSELDEQGLQDAIEEFAQNAAN